MCAACRHFASKRAAVKQMAQQSAPSVPSAATGVHTVTVARKGLQDQRLRKTPNRECCQLALLVHIFSSRSDMHRSRRKTLWSVPPLRAPRAHHLPPFKHADLKQRPNNTACRQFVLLVHTSIFVRCDPLVVPASWGSNPSRLSFETRRDVKLPRTIIAMLCFCSILFDSV